MKFGCTKGIYIFHQKPPLCKLNDMAGTGTVFIRQNLTSVDVRFWHIKRLPAPKTYNTGIQMKREELTKTFMMISNWKTPWSPWFIQKYLGTLRVTIYLHIHKTHLPSVFVVIPVLTNHLVVSEPRNMCYTNCLCDLQHNM